MRATFQGAREEALNLMKLSSKVQWKPTSCEGGYFLPIDVSETRDIIPSKYFDPKRNYEDDPNTLVISKQFTDRKEVPVDYAFSRWNAIENGITFMPISGFCLDESPTKLENFVRLAVCKTPESFREESIRNSFKNL